jgi:hypothetical protein
MLPRPAEPYLALETRETKSAVRSKLGRDDGCARPTVKVVDYQNQDPSGLSNA